MYLSKRATADQSMSVVEWAQMSFYKCESEFRNDMKLDFVQLDV